MYTNSILKFLLFILLSFCQKSVVAQIDNDTIGSNVGKRYYSYKGLRLREVIFREGYEILDSLNYKYENLSNDKKIKFIKQLIAEKKWKKTNYRLTCYFVCQNYVYEENDDVKFSLLVLLESTGLSYWHHGFHGIWPFLFYPDYSGMNLKQLESLYHLIMVLYPPDFYTWLDDTEKDYIMNLKKAIVKKSGGSIEKL